MMREGLILYKFVCYWYSLEASCQTNSNEFKQHSKVPKFSDAKKTLL